MGEKKREEGRDGERERAWGRGGGVGGRQLYLHQWDDINLILLS